MTIVSRFPTDLKNRFNFKLGVHFEYLLLTQILCAQYNTTYKNVFRKEII